MTEQQKRRQGRDRPGTARGGALSRTPRVSLVAAVLAGGLALVVAFQVSLAAGAPWGAAAWGGAQHGELPTNLRVASAFSAVFWLFATLTVLTRGGFTTPLVRYSFSRRAIWALTALLAVGAVTNAASSSDWERFGWAPFVLALAALALQLARSPFDVPTRPADTG